jgi:hypothetical protein
METEKLLFTLFIFGNFKGRGAEGELLQPLIPITLDESLKYVYELYTMIVQFDTDLPKEELTEYLKATYKSNDIQYYLVPKGEELSVDLPSKIKNNLKELENNSERVRFISHGYKIDTEKSMDDFDKIIQYFMSESDFQDMVFEDEDDDPMLRPQKKNPTLDDLLDKIIDKGVLSLSEEEKRLLTHYSNEYK